MRVVALMVMVVLLGLLSPTAARAAPERYFVKVVGVEPVNGVPPEVAARVGTLLVELTKGRPEFVADLAGAPEDSEKLKKWLAQKKIRAFAVTVKIPVWERALEPAKDGKTGQVLKLRVNLHLVGAAIPGDVMALTGEGGSTVMVEVGKTVRPKDDQYAADEALKEATQHALEEAVTRLRASGKKK